MTHGHSINPASGKIAVLGITLLAVAYVGAYRLGWPQHGTELVRAAAHHNDHASHEDQRGSHGRGGHPAEHGGHPAADAGAHGDIPGSLGGSTAALTANAPSTRVAEPGFLLVGPFVALLMCIAVLPLIPQTEHWWESNLHRFYVAAGLAAVTLGYYLLLHNAAVEAHWPAHAIVTPTAGEWLQWELAWTVMANAIMHEYIPFIVLLFSLYTISGGIRIEGNLAAHPLTNSAFIAVGGALASFIGTTGAAMLLIRPLLETNKERHYKVHTVIFFIFVVCNCGGCLLPIGDPPLFLGYLRGVDFFWTLNLWKIWLFVNAMLLAVYWVWDHFILYPRETRRDIAVDEIQTRNLRISGWLVNVPLLVGVVVCVALLDPSKPVLGTSWHAPMYLREMVQLVLVALSLILGSTEVRRKNYFTFHAILEVAALFFGIFVCMQPALQILNVRGPLMGVDSPQEFFWMTGGLSSVLDNAPTYVVFFETARTLNEGGAALPVTIIREPFLVAISLGSVFMGAMTYIGNGPNFMVKAIAETSGVQMPSFFAYMKYSFVILLPILLITTLIFL